MFEQLVDELFHARPPEQASGKAWSVSPDPMVGYAMR